MVHYAQNEPGCQSASPITSTHDDSPIIAIATAPGRGGVGVIRLSGRNLEPIIKGLVGQKFLSPRHAYYLPIHDGQNVLIDQAIVLHFPAPHSFTGEDVLELQGHGGGAVMQLLVQRCLELGQDINLRIAAPGEFSMRAFFNDKIDLIQAEAIADLVNASSAAAAKAAAASLTGSFSKEIQKLAEQITSVRILVEATLDFPEEEIEFIEKYQVKDKLTGIRVNLEEIIRISAKSCILKDGLKVVLAGEPNVGKSSLLNAICDQELAIVTDIAGTTRDRIREFLHIDGIPVHLTDTAGLRTTTDKIESIGIERSWQAIREADLVLEVSDARNPSSILSVETSDSSNRYKTLRVLNKADLLTPTASTKLHIDDDTVVVSAKTHHGIEELKSRIVAAAGREFGEVSPWLGRARHVQALKSALHHLELASEYANQQDRTLDLLAEELRLCHVDLGSITGQMSADDLLGKIFSTFCIGK